MDKKAKSPVEHVTGKWPSGREVTDQEREVIERNRATSNVEWVKGTVEPTAKK